MDQLNPGLRNLVNLGKSYEKAVTGTDFKLAKVCFSTSLGLTLWKHKTSLAVNCGNKAEVNICWLISLPYTLMFNTIKHQMVQLVLLTERLTASPPVQPWPLPGRPISRQCPNSERMPLCHWCPRSSVSFVQIQVLLSVSEGFSRFHLNVNAILQRETGWFVGAETWSYRLYVQKGSNPLNSFFCYIPGPRLFFFININYLQYH